MVAFIVAPVPAATSRSRTSWRCCRRSPRSSTWWTSSPRSRRTRASPRRRSEPPVLGRLVSVPDVASAAVPLARVLRGDLVESVHLGHLVVLAPGRVGAARARRPRRHDLGAVVAQAAAGRRDAARGARRRPRAAGPRLREPQRRGRAPGRRPHAPVRWPGWAPTTCATPRTGRWTPTRRSSGAPTGTAPSRSRRTAPASTPGCWRRAWRTAGRTTTTSTRRTRCSSRSARRVADLTGVPVEHATVDGCGAPLFSTTLVGLARSFGRLASAARGARGAGRPRDERPPVARRGDRSRRHPVHGGRAGTGRQGRCRRGLRGRSARRVGRGVQDPRRVRAPSRRPSSRRRSRWPASTPRWSRPSG